MYKKVLNARLKNRRKKHIHCVSKNIPDIFDFNLNKKYQILIIFGANSPDTCH